MAADVIFRFLQRSQDEKDELQAKNDQIFCYLQKSLISASLSRLNLSDSSSKLTHLYQIFICKIYILLWLKKFWDTF